ncbi:hypothetical protein [Stackebrandtia endophytica]|uniref:hypothetical protein n=1 Tax=Stackebrandtia endophytica TaxID=1496996 RepID=UPI0036D32276
MEVLGARLRAIIGDLPQDDATRAAGHLETANERLTAAMRESVGQAGTVHIAAAHQHLDRALTSLKLVADRLDDYLVAIGVATVGKADNETLATVPIESPRDRTRADWWNERINHISDGDATADRSEVPLTRLFSELVDLAGRGDRDGYRARLLAAGPVNGVKLSGLSWPMIRTLSVDVLKRPVLTSDDESLTRVSRDAVRKLLPKLPDGVMLAQLRGANSLPHDRAAASDDDSPRAGGPHPADAAAVGPVLVSALLRAREQTRKES